MKTSITLNNLLPSEQDSPWQENTYANPFYNEKRVEVKLLDGTTKILDCPKCARGMFQFVTQWRMI